MSDLISRQKTYEVLTEYYHHNTKVQHDALREALDRVPSAELERKKGENHENYDECSKCHCFTSVGFNYCPHCGADMRGD